MDPEWIAKYLQTQGYKPEIARTYAENLYRHKGAGDPITYKRALSAWLWDKKMDDYGTGRAQPPDLVTPDNVENFGSPAIRGVVSGFQGAMRAYADRAQQDFFNRTEQSYRGLVQRNNDAAGWASAGLTPPPDPADATSATSATSGYHDPTRQLALQQAGN